jgi:hypothetical protein
MKMKMEQRYVVSRFSLREVACSLRDSTRTCCGKHSAGLHCVLHEAPVCYVATKPRGYLVLEAQANKQNGEVS